MKLLFIGEGRHDIGVSPQNPFHPRPAEGTIPTLSRRICPQINSDSIALAWHEIYRFSAGSVKRGYEAKIKAAALVACKRYDCSGTVVVADRDGDEARESSLSNGSEIAGQLFPEHKVVWGLACESVEAWTLGATQAIAKVLDVQEARIRQLYPAGLHVEKLCESSGKEEHRPKQLLKRIAQLRHREDTTEFREEIASRTEIPDLESACPAGFAPFAARIRKVLQSPDLNLTSSQWKPG